MTNFLFHPFWSLLLFWMYFEFGYALILFFCLFLFRLGRDQSLYKSIFLPVPFVGLLFNFELPFRALYPFTYFLFVQNYFPRGNSTSC